MPKIYTKTGDLGKTNTYSGVRVSKSCNTINALGDLDELNACLGLVRVYLTKSASSKLTQIQTDLFSIGSVLAGYADGEEFKGFVSTKVRELEQTIDEMSAKLPSLSKFVLPGGCASAAQLQFARAVCRRCGGFAQTS